MAEYRLSETASYDLDDIADYTFETFGEHQADKYSSELLNMFVALAARPFIGKVASELAPELRSYPFKAHVIYYAPEKDGILSSASYITAETPSATYDGDSSVSRCST